MTVVEPAYLQLKAGTELNGEELEHQRLKPCSKYSVLTGGSDFP